MGGCENRRGIKTEERGSERENRIGRGNRKTGEVGEEYKWEGKRDRK